MTIARFVLATSLASAVALGAHLSAQGEGAVATECSVAALQQKAPAGTTITGAKVVDAAGPQPAFCQVDGHVAVPGNEVNIRVGLPQRWNGKFYFSGVGGLGGQMGALTAGLARGYASASTDTGHLASDPSWGSNRAKELDYGHRGTHVTAVAGKELTAAFYGRPPLHAYFNGCSNGGRQALMEVQRYPSDFDGIIAGDPATGTPMQAGRALVFQKLLASAESYLPNEKIEMLSKATLAACDAVDGLKDGLVSDPPRCTFKPESLKCKGADGPNCLTAPQLDVVKQIYDGARLPSGEVYAYGFPLGHEGSASGWRAWTTGTVPPTGQPDGTFNFTTNLPSGFALSEQNFRFLALDDDDPYFNWRVFRLDRDLPRMKIMTDILSPLDPDLRPFKGRNGRLLMYHGWSDPAISAYGTIDYYDKVGKVVGGQKDLESFARLYLVPGMHHCSGGPGPNEFDMLTVLENWVEHNVAPAAVVATHKTNGTVDRTRPLCPHPQVARYSGTGSVDEAANFRCDVPAR
jgi:Tannase and feruloyl esterase